MCGIVGYIGFRKSLPAVLDSLKRLEYRGYDSAGAAFFSAGARPGADGQNGKNLKVVKACGWLVNLEKKLKSESATENSAVLGHTRWATHGAPNEINAHPHFDCQKRIALVHNGIIENYLDLKEKLTSRGHRFVSETDTEVIAHLIEEQLKTEPDFKKAFEKGLKKISGTYALAAVDRETSDRFYVARLGSPLIVGFNKKECLAASDLAALAGKFKKVVFLKDRQWAEINLKKPRFYPGRPKMETLVEDFSEAKLGRFPHFMLKEIFEGPETLRSAFRGRLSKKGVKLGGLEQVTDRLKKIKRLKIIAAGTSYYAGLLGEYFFEDAADLPVEVHLSSEWLYKKEPFDREAVCLFISQSGETADTLAALRKAKTAGYLCLGLVNVVGSSIARETDAGVYNHAGPEIGVASTKIFLSQVGILYLMALLFNQIRGRKNSAKLLSELLTVPDKIEEVLKKSEAVKALAKKYLKHRNFYFLGRRYNYPVALEGALKLKEVSYIHAEGYAAGEMKHGPIALVDEKLAVAALATRNGVYEKMVSNLEEVKARRALILALATRGDEKIAKIADDVFYLPAVSEPLEPLVNVVPFQLFAYYFGTLAGYNVDKPRNLAKSVTVE